MHSILYTTHQSTTRLPKIEPLQIVAGTINNRIHQKY